MGFREVIESGERRILCLFSVLGTLPLLYLKCPIYSHYLGTNIATFFRECHDGNISAMKVQVIEKVRVPKRGGDAFRILCCREVVWIHRLQTRIPSSLNFLMGCEPLLWLEIHIYLFYLNMTRYGLIGLQYNYWFI